MAAARTAPGMSATTIFVGNGNSFLRSKNESAAASYVLPPLIVPPLMTQASQRNQSRTAVQSSSPTLVWRKRARLDERRLVASRASTTFSSSSDFKNANWSRQAAKTSGAGKAAATSRISTEAAPDATSRSTIAARVASMPAFTTLHASVPSRNTSCSWPPSTKSTQPSAASALSAASDWCVSATTRAQPSSSRKAAAPSRAASVTSRIARPRKVLPRKTPSSDVRSPSKPTFEPQGNSKTARSGKPSTAPGTLLLRIVPLNSPQRRASASRPMSAS
mmetsp:Transcript_21353/g.67037  ORF Transcript_21353/g.67037 Transcript_21353/m.67037 type:complete len:277 (-) Transcript_21353:235-1065(-)